MIIVAMLLCGPVSGRFCTTTRQALTVLVLAFVLVAAVQTIIVANTSDGLPLVYWLVQIAALAGGLLLLWLGVALRQRNHRTG